MEENQNSKEPHQTTPGHVKVNGLKAKLLHSISLPMVMVAILFTIFGATGAYVLEHRKVTAGMSKIGDLQQLVKQLNSETASLQSKYQNADQQLNEDTQSKVASTPNPITQVETPTQTDLALTINNAVRCNALGNPGGAATGVAVELTVTDTTTTPISFVMANVEVQDSQNHTYQIMPSYVSTYLPSGYTVLGNQTINPGQTVSGWLMFQVNDASQTNFKLLNGPKAYPFTTN